MSVSSRFAANERDRSLAMAAHLFDTIAARSRDVEGVSRPAFSPIETATLELLQDFARGEGLQTWSDAGRNAWFCLPGDQDESQVLVVGSHVDSVPFGGNFDGLAGVVAGLICLTRARRQGDRLARPVHVLALRGEESAWFGPCYIGSKALTGTLSPAELNAVHKGDGEPLDSHMERAGIAMEAVRAGRPLIALDRITGYLELHIEQGPLLIGKNLPAGLVSGIRGALRHRCVRCLGEAGHSGAVPRAYRRDPVLAMADLLVRLDEHWSTILAKGNDLVLTSGIVATDPDKHAMSRIPDAISFSLDIRSQSAHTLNEMRVLLKAEMREVARDRKVVFEPGEEIRVEPALCDPALLSGLEAAMRRTGLEPFVMPSGGGHDAAIFAAAGIPSAMVFTRNHNGSHNPEEAMDLTDFLAATDIVYEFVKGET